jgi:hypothetical protein
MIVGTVIYILARWFFTILTHRSGINTSLCGEDAQSQRGSWMRSTHFGWRPNTSYEAGISDNLVYYLLSFSYFLRPVILFHGPPLL